MGSGLMEGFLTAIGEFESFLADGGFEAAADPDLPEDDPELPDDDPELSDAEPAVICAGVGEGVADPRRVDGGAAPVTPPAKKACPPWRSNEASGAAAPAWRFNEASGAAAPARISGDHPPEWVRLLQDVPPQSWSSSSVGQVEAPAPADPTWQTDPQWSGSSSSAGQVEAPAPADPTWQTDPQWSGWSDWRDDDPPEWVLELREEQALAQANQIPWRDRGPEGQAGDIWRGQHYRPNSKRFANRGGRFKFYYGVVYTSQKAGATKQDAHAHARRECEAAGEPHPT